MDASILVAIFFIGMIGLIVYGVIDGFRRNSHKVDNNSFSQAGVTVNFQSGIVKIKSKRYDAQKIKSIRWESGHGPHGNISEAYIEVDDFDTPIHKLQFIKSGDAEKFSQRLRMAINKTNGSVTSHPDSTTLVSEHARTELKGHSDIDGAVSESKNPFANEYELISANIEDNRVRDAVQILNKQGLTVFKVDEGWSVVDRDGQRQHSATVNQLEGRAVSAKA